jgi:pyruvate/2-oxoglutarate dehydrogenase complex dihydrolipoamide dehydrogenase (E3) component/membrane protein DedA with SNARE-associated domain
LFAGALFGNSVGLLVVSFASSIGATLAFLSSRFIFREAIQQKFANKLKGFNKGFAENGTSYLFTMRLVPVVPFFVINLLMGLTKMPVLKFYVVSQLAMLPGTFVYVNAGRALGELESLSGILSIELLGAFVLLGIFPYIAKFIVNRIKARKVYKGFKKPKQFDQNLVVIGAGAGGLVTSYIAAAMKAQVTLIERHKMGGDCLNTGCVPSKALIKAASYAKSADKAKSFGVDVTKNKVDLKEVMAHVNNSVTAIEPHDSVERYEGLGVNCVQGTAQIISPWEVKVGDKVISAKNIVLATGGVPFVPEFEGKEDVPYLTSDTVWPEVENMKKLLIMGAGPIGCELAQALNRLDVQVDMVNRSQHFLPREDNDVSDFIEQQLTSEGVTIHHGLNLVRMEKTSTGGMAHFDNGESIEFSHVLFAMGRKANVKSFGDALDITLTEDGRIKTDAYLRTNYPNIYAVGDATTTKQFTHLAAHTAWYAAVNSLIGIKKFKLDDSIMPRVTYTAPEVATVGLTEKEALAQGLEFDVIKYGVNDLDRAITDGEAQGFVKVLTPKGKDKILGATIVASQAGEMLTEFTLAMKHGLGLNKILGTIHPYPTMSEANKYVAGQWRQKNKPEFALKLLEKFFTWRRG